jgi:oxygen-independent coproporphyrinogen-3 oxidase
MHEASLRHIEASGYERYEISALAKPGYECRHNLNYWRFGDYLGIGAGAHGKLTDASGRIWRSEKPSNPRRYVEASLAAEPAPRRLLGADDAVFEFMLNGLRLTRGFGAPDFEKRTGQPFARVLSQLVVAEKQGLIREAGGDVWQPTARGRSFLNDLQSRFLPSRTG